MSLGNAIKASSKSQREKWKYGPEITPYLGTSHAVNGFESVEGTSQFNEDFIKNYNEEGQGFFWGWCSMSWKIMWLSQWFTNFTWTNEDWKSRKACSYFTW